MLLFIGVIIWNVERILYYTYQSLTQCAAEILTSILNTPYEDATFTLVGVKVWKSQLIQGQTLKRNSYSRTLNQKSSYDEMILKL